MKIEIVEFYQITDPKRENKKLFGSLHAYLIDEKIDLRGISVFNLGKGKFKMIIPSRIGYDRDTGKPVRYPVFSFNDVEKTRAMVMEINRQGTEYINKVLTQ